MKKIIAMLLALLFVIALAACGSKTEEAASAPVATQAPAAEQKQET
jgi:predicted small lipoprotein YifL